MGRYNIYLGNPHGIVYAWKELCFAVRDLFVPVFEDDRRFDGVYVRSTMLRPSVDSHELLIYVVKSPLRSVVRHLGRDPMPSQGGFTVEHSAKGTGSEVYNAHSSPRFLAKLIYHEALHNKTRIYGDRLHSGGGLASSPLSPRSEVTPDNVRLMRRYIARRVPQWLGGFK